MDFKLDYFEKEGYTPIVTSENQTLSFIRFGMLRLSDKGSFGESTNEEEVCLVILSGKCSLSSDGVYWKSIGKRNNVFEGKACALYVPPKSEYEVIAEEKVEIAICKAPSNYRGRARLITPDDIKTRELGRENYRRKAYDILDSKMEAGTLLIGETISLAGNWSSYPPHKHDRANLPEESSLEELYFFKVGPVQGFGIQRIYSDNRHLDELFLIKNNTLALIPYGYHPVAAAPGYLLYYLWVLAGKKRVVKMYDDPEYNWLKS